MKRQPRKRLIRDRSHPLIKAAGLSAAALAERAGYSLRQTLYALDGRRTCPERVADVLCATLGPDGWRFLCGEADSVTLTRTFKAGPEIEPPALASGDDQSLSTLVKGSALEAALAANAESKT